MATVSDLARLSPYITAILGGPAGGVFRNMGAANVAKVSKAGANFGPARKGGRDFVVTPNNAPMRNDQLGSVDAAIGLAERMKSDPIDFDANIVFIPGSPQNNAGLVRTPENLESFLRQSEKEHEDALTQFLDNPNIPPEDAKRLGVRAEENLAKWWNDKDPRRAVTPTSSAVRKARIGSNGDIYVTFAGGDKEYQYEGSPDPVRASEILRDLVTAESIGRSVNSWNGDWGTRHTYLPK